jgi:hypothetical protein
MPGLCRKTRGQPARLLGQSAKDLTTKPGSQTPAYLQPTSIHAQNHRNIRHGNESGTARSPNIQSFSKQLMMGRFDDAGEREGERQMGKDVEFYIRATRRMARLDESWN